MSGSPWIGESLAVLEYGLEYCSMMNGFEMILLNSLFQGQFNCTCGLGVGYARGDPLGLE
jgi:hypothetical protein